MIEEGTNRIYMFTHSGRKFYLDAPDSRDVSIRDIAYHLAGLERFTGAMPRPISVAQHSVFVAGLIELLGGTLYEQQRGLMHDAAEAYTGDISRPMKDLMLRRMGFDMHTATREIEEAVIGRFFPGRGLEDPPIVKRADLLACWYESKWFHSNQCCVTMAHDPFVKSKRILDLGEIFSHEPWPRRWAETQFLNTVRLLFRRSGGEDPVLEFSSYGYEQEKTETIKSTA